MMAYTRSIISLIAACSIVPVCLAGEVRDVKAFVETAFADRITGMRDAVYCTALACNVEIEAVTATQTALKTYELSITGSLEGTIPGLKGSAKRTVSLVSSYVINTCIFKDIKSTKDVTENNHGWGASRIEHVFKSLSVPPNVILSKEDCQKVDSYLAGLL